MIRTIIFFSYFFLYLLFSLPKLFKVNRMVKQGHIEERDRFLHAQVLKWGRALLKISGSTIRVTGEENIPKEGAVVFISNHQGSFDIPIILGFLDKPKAIVAKTEVLKIPLFPAWMKHMKCVFMNRSDIRQSLQAINEAVENIKNGYSMVIFPEGTRSNGIQMGEFKSGSFKLALKAKVPIIPITMSGTYKLMKNNSIIIHPGVVDVFVSKPIITADLTKEQIAKLPDLVKEMIAEHLPRRE